MHDTLLIGWTTVDSEAAARRLGNGLVTTRLAACVQIDACVESVYLWEGAVQSTRECRTTRIYRSAAPLRCAGVGRRAR
jgi:uncharacterized protein involved in tolerance to divalent cations